MSRAKARGATILRSGEPSGNFFPLAVLTDVTPEIDAFHEEFFGLVSYVYMTDQEQALRVADGIDAGMVWITLVLGDAVELPFGGVKCSGTGHEMGRPAMDEYATRSSSASRRG